MHIGEKIREIRIEPSVIPIPLPQREPVEPTPFEVPQEQPDVITKK
jgi:hypothetical protein